MASSQTGNLKVEFYRQQEIVAIEILNEFASRCETPRLARRAGATALAVNRPNFGMCFCQRFRFAPRLVG
jgi:hypothetical protein